MINIGYAHLPDGRRMDYEEYLRTTEWILKKKNRLAFDNWQCGLCHRTIDGTEYETHHVFYSHLGNEDIEHDLVSLCPGCHRKFHEQWKKNDFWISSGSPIEHWKTYSLKDTAKLCMFYLSYDYWFGGEFNLCSADTVKEFIDKYCEDFNVPAGVQILETDVTLFVRNARYKEFLEALDNKISLDDFLDSHFGSKGQKGGNKKRADARSFCTKHKVAAIKRFCKENENILILIDEVKKLEDVKDE